MATPTIITLAEFNAARAVVAKVIGEGRDPDTDEVLNGYGYGQTLTSSASLSEVTAPELIKLRNDILVAAYHQRGPSGATLVPAFTNTITGAVSEAIRLATLGTGTKAGTIDLEKTAFYTGTGAKTGTTNLYTTSLTTDDWNSTTTHTVVINFTNADEMRWYFNSGGLVQIKPARSGTTSTKNTAWTTLLTVGTISFKNTGTFSSKATTTTPGKGYNSLTDEDQVIFTKTSTAKTETYTIKAKKFNSESSIMFTTTFSNTGANVTGELKNDFTTLYGSRLESDTFPYLQVAPPTLDADLSNVDVGLATPSFTVTKNPTNVTTINETGKTITVSYTITTSNYRESDIYYTIVKVDSTNAVSVITETDFVDIPLSGSLSVDPDTHIAQVLTITANADLTTEGKTGPGIDKFTVQFRATDNAEDPLLPINIGTITVNDTSLTPPAPTPTVSFVPLPVGKAALYTKEGETISVNIVGANIPESAKLITYKIRGTGTSNSTIKSTDFIENTINGTFELTDGKYTLDITIADDSSILDALGAKIYEKAETFLIDLFLTNPVTKQPNTKPDASSYVIQIAADDVPVIPFEVVDVQTEMTEGNKTVGVQATIKTPFLPTANRKVWYQIYPASEANAISKDDFTDGKLDGYVDIKILGNSGIGTFIKYATGDKFVEGREGFYVDFFQDQNQTQKINTSVHYFYINENTPYVATRSAPTLWEPIESKPDKITEVTFTLTTPFIPNDPPTMVQWEVVTVPGFGSLTEEDFEGGAISGEQAVVDNKVSVPLRARYDGVTEGNEQFFVRFTYPYANGTATKDTPVATLSEDVAFEITPQNDITTIAEVLAANATGITFDIKTPWLTKNTSITWEAKAVNPSYKIASTDFKEGKTSGTIIVNPTTITNTATLTLTPIVDPDVEGNELFYVILKYNGKQVAQSPDITITEDIKYKIYPASTTVKEGSTALKFNITTPKVIDGTKVEWEINQGTGITASDFLVTDDQSKVPEQRLSGYVLTKGNKASFTLLARQDAVLKSSEGTEADETFTVTINPNDKDISDTTTTLTVQDVSPYLITANVFMVRETDDLTILTPATTRDVNFTIYTPYMPSGTLYYSVEAVSGTVNQNDFAAGSLIASSFTVTQSVGQVSLTLADDKTREGNESFVIKVKTGSTTGTVVPNGTSPKITIYDNSVQGEVVPVIGTFTLATVPPGIYQVTEGNDITFRLITTGVSTADNLFWSLSPISPVNSSDLVKLGTTSLDNSEPFHVNSGGIADITFHANTDIYNELSGEVFIFRVHQGSLLDRDIKGRITMTIVDPTPYSITTNSVTNRINESNQSGVVFNITTPQEMYSATMKWIVVAEPDTTTLTGNDFILPNPPPTLDPNTGRGYTFDLQSLSGLVGIDSSGTGQCAVYAKKDNMPEGLEGFRIKLIKPTGPGTWESQPIAGVESPLIRIVDDTGYTLTPNSTSVTAGTLVTYNLTTPVQTKASTWNIALLGNDLEGSVTPETATISLITTKTSYSFNVKTSDSMISNKKFTVQFTDSTGLHPAVSGNPEILVTANEKFSIIPKVNGVLDTNIMEDTTLTFDVLSSTSPIYWNLVSEGSPAIDASDFKTNQPLSGTLIPSSRKATITLPFSTRSTKVGSKRFYVFLSKTQTNPTAVDGGTSVVVTKNEIAAYSISTANNVTQIQEGSPLMFTFTAPYAATNKVYTYEVISTINEVTPVAGVTNPGNKTGTITVLAGYSSTAFSLSVPDNSINDTRTYKVIIKDGANIVISEANTLEITVISSATYAAVVTASAANSAPITSVMEGNSLTYTVTPPGKSNGTLVWTLVRDRDPGSDFIASHVTAKDATGEVNISTSGTAKGKYQFTVTTTKDNPLSVGNNTNRQFKLQLKDKKTNEILTIAPNPVVTITDFEQMSVVDNGVVPKGGSNPYLIETNAAIEFTVTTLSADNGYPLKWEIVDNTTNLVPANLGLSATSGTTNNVSSNQVKFSITTAPDNFTNKPEKAFAIKFTSQQGAKKSITSRLVKLEDTSKTPPAEKYAVEDSALPKLPLTAPSIDEDGNNNTVTFTVTTKTGEVGPLYWKIQPSPGSVINKSHFAAITGADYTGLSGSTTITNKTATLTLTTTPDKTEYKPPKSFYVQFSLTSTFPANVAKELTSRTILIKDTVKPDPYVPNYIITVVSQPDAITLNQPFVVECEITPVLPSVMVDNTIKVSWRATSTNSTIPPLLNYVEKPDIVIKDFTTTVTTTNQQNQTKPNTVFCTLRMKLANKDPDPCGQLAFNFKFNDPLSLSNTIETSTSQILVNHMSKVYTVFKNMDWTVPADVYNIKVTLVGSGGTGGSAFQYRPNTAFKGGDGDKLVGNMGVLPGKKISFLFVNGGAGGPAYSLSGAGGAGGTAVVIKSDNIIQGIAAGGGGGAGGNLSGGVGSNPIQTTSSPTSAVGQTVPSTYPGLGGGGGTGGKARIDSITNNAGISYVTNLFQRTGTGGTGTNGESLAFSINNKVSYDLASEGSNPFNNYSEFLRFYAIFDKQNPKAASFTGHFYNITYISPGSYILRCAAQNSGTVTINDTVYKCSSNRMDYNEYNIQIASNWNGYIKVSATRNSAEPFFGVAAAIYNPNDMNFTVWDTGHEAYQPGTLTVAPAPAAAYAVIEYTAQCDVVEHILFDLRTAGQSKAGYTPKADGGDSDGPWDSWMKSHAVNFSGTQSWDINFPTTRYYRFHIGTDQSGGISLDGTSVLYSSGFSYKGGNDIYVQVTAGTHTISCQYTGDHNGRDAMAAVISYFGPKNIGFWENANAGTYSVSVPVGAVGALITCIGAGGGSGSGHDNAGNSGQSGAAGGAGGVSVETKTVTAGSVLNITVGKGGAGAGTEWIQTVPIYHMHFGTAAAGTGSTVKVGTETLVSASGGNPGDSGDVGAGYTDPYQAYGGKGGTGSTRAGGNGGNGTANTTGTAPGALGGTNDTSYGKGANSQDIVTKTYANPADVYVGLKGQDGYVSVKWL